MMKRFTVILLSVFLSLSFAGCNRILGGTILEISGMEFSSQIAMIEACLSVDLEDLTDNDIKPVYSFTDESGNDLTIRYIDLEGAGEYFEKGLAGSSKWQALPYDSVVEDLLASSGADEHYDLSAIDEGYFIVSGVALDGSEFDFDREHMKEWYVFEIGLWDSSDETLYHISITNQPTP